ncbi:hypothetical protein RclHR1_11200008 [Rhizophagus clarus]|uniref:GLTSCR protein conserved domain-containing protein n=1 Tax=Rhizophagus clarus TaxID=94130 RepID=A0A2Z6Q587_9GLOM|nr:hypothetical protein RclHR1_11200008 [Rhizophagus clarus]
MPIIMATVMNYKDEDIEKFEENNSQNNGELLKGIQNNANTYETLHKSSKKATSPNTQNISELVVKEEKSDDLNQVCVKNSSSTNNNTQDNNSNPVQSELNHKQFTQQIYINGTTPESNNNCGDMELTNCQSTGQFESSNGFRKNLIEKKDTNWNGYQNQNNSNVINSSSNLQNNVYGTGISNGQHNNNSNSSQNQTIPLCEQEGQVKMMKLAGLTVIMHRKKGEIIYKLADNMSVSSLSDAQREALLKEIKTLHDSNAIVTQSMPQPTQDQGTSTISSQSVNTTASRLPTTTSLPEHPSVINHNTSTKVQSSLASASVRSSSFPISTSTSSNKSINSTAALNTRAPSKQLYIPLASRPPLVVTETYSAAQLSDRSPSNMTSQTLYPTSPLEDSFYSDGSSRSTRRYTKTGRYAKKRSTDEVDSQYTQEYPTQYQHIPISTTVPINNQMSTQSSQVIQPVPSPQPVQSTYYTSTTPTTRPIVQYYSAPTPLHRPSHGLKRSFQPIGPQRTAEEINHNLDIAQRFEAATKADQMAVLQPDYKTPFRSLKDAVARLLPYHIFEYPEEDMKGNNQTSDLDATKNALRLYKRRKMIFDKYNDLLKSEAEKSCSTAYTNLCERLIVDDVKTEIVALKESCRQLSEQIKSRSQFSMLKQQQQQLQLQQLHLQSSSTQQSKQPELPQRQS